MRQVEAKEGEESGMIDYIELAIIPAAYRLLPREMKSIEATMMLLAIGQHESGFKYRKQRPAGPARGLWQFEVHGGLQGVLRHSATKDHAKDVCHVLGYQATIYDLDEAIRHNDILACAFARLLLWTLPGPLPAIGDQDEAYRQYREAWRPGKPRPQDWPADYAKALFVMNI